MTQLDSPLVATPAPRRSVAGRMLQYVTGGFLQASYLSVFINVLYAIGWSAVLGKVGVHGAAKMSAIGGAALASIVVMAVVFTVALLPVFWMLARSWRAGFWLALAWDVPLAGFPAGIFALGVDLVLVHVGTRLTSKLLGWLPHNYAAQVVDVQRALSHGVSAVTFLGLFVALLLALVVEWLAVRLFRLVRSRSV